MTKTVLISHFLSTDFKSFSVYDCLTNLPNLVDGLKISQRKTMWAVINSPKTYTVEQLAAHVSSYTKYHHGSTSLEGVIVGMAQNFTGSNNVNWLTPDGQFGNILNHTPSSARYISTNINSNWRKWFQKDDDIIMEYEIEDGEVTEPKFFIPIVPTILFNGSSGIGTGYSTSILGYNPKEVVENVRAVLKGKQQTALIPWYSGYKGTITKEESGQTVYKGAYEKVNATAIRITQLPIGYDIEKYKEILIRLIESGEIKDFDDHSTEDKWDITLYASREWIKQHESIIYDKLKLITKDTETFVVWDENQKIKRFSNPNDIIEYFVNWRVGKYEERRLKLISNLNESLIWLNEKRRFIAHFIENSKKLVDLGKIELIDHLTTENFQNIDRLLQIRVYNMTRDEILSLDNEIKDVQSKIDALQKTTAPEMYLGELKMLKV